MEGNKIERSCPGFGGLVPAGIRHFCNGAVGKFRGRRAHKACSNRTLLGDYGTKLEGTILGPNLTLRTLVLAHFDGEGNINEVDHVVLNGTPPAAEEEWRASTGTYTINPDCTGSAILTILPGAPPLMYHFIVVKNGRESSKWSTGMLSAESLTKLSEEPQLKTPARDKLQKFAACK